MQLHHDPALLDADERFRAVASTLAVGVLRLRSRPAFPADPAPQAGPKKSPKSIQDGLEVRGETVLSVHTG